jgi:1-acyl-sn-glycerol-3-phosphate acyltransferase
MMTENLAPMKGQVYRDPRPKEYFDRFHERARTRDPDYIYQLVRMLLTAVTFILYRARCIASDRVPLEGPVILAPNHFSFMDHFLIAVFLRRQVRFMAKSQLFKRPMQFIYTHGGVFPVRRGARDEEAFITSGTILDRGGLIAMYCEGGRSRSGHVGERGAKPGIGRLALESGAPVIPVAIHGSSRIRNWKRLQFPKVTVQYGEALQWERVPSPTHEQQQAVADEILEEIKDVYIGLERLGRRGMVQRVRHERRAASRARRAATA